MLICLLLTKLQQDPLLPNNLSCVNVHSKKADKFCLCYIPITQALWYTGSYINHTARTLPCSVFEGPTQAVWHHCFSSFWWSQWAIWKQEETHDANEDCWQVIINVALIAFSSKGPSMSHSIIRLNRSSCKCGVLFKRYPSVISNAQVPCLSTLSIRLRGH